jgi:hypothetical protein
LSFVDPIDSENRRDFDADVTLILCEGKSDASLFRHLLDARGEAGFRIGFPDKDHTAYGHGKTQFQGFLDVAPLRSGFLRHVKRVVIVTDNDHAEAFPDAAAQVPEDHFARPKQPGVAEHANGKISVAVMLVPEASAGAIESIILAACEWSAAQMKCLDDYCVCTNISGWSQSQLDKMRLRCVIAATCATNPDCSVTWMWKDSNKGLPFKLTSPSLDQLVMRLKSFV